MPVIIVKGYSISEDMLLKERLIGNVKKGAEKAFGKDGIIPIIPGGVSIIPAFTNPTDVRQIFIVKPSIEVYLHEKAERTPKLLEAVKKEFEIAMDGRFVVTLNPQPEELFITF